MHSDVNAEIVLSYILTVEVDFFEWLQELTIIVLSLRDISDIECSGPNVNTVQVNHDDFTFFCNIFNLKFCFFHHRMPGVLRTNKLRKSFHFQLYQNIYK